jgi:hypothetical protein
VQGGRQTLLIEQGKIRLGATSQEGIHLLGGEQLAATRIIESVTVTGARDAPGFRIQSPAVAAFIDSSRIATGRRSISPGFLYTAAVPRQVTECLRCSVSGVRTAFEEPQLRAKVAARDRATFDHLNADAILLPIRAPFNVKLPGATGSPVLGRTVTAETGDWTSSPATYAYQWVRCKRADVPSNPATRCMPVGGATGSAYTVTRADAGFYLRVTVSAANSSGVGTATSLPMLVTG